MPKKRIIPPRVMIPTKKTIKKCLSKDAQLSVLRHTFGQIPDRRHGGGKIPLVDVLMSGYAVFDLKDPSLLAFDDRRCLPCGRSSSLRRGSLAKPSSFRMSDMAAGLKGFPSFSSARLMS